MKLKRLIIFLIRKRLGLELFEDFQFANQRSQYDRYYFAPDKLIKIETYGDGNCYTGERDSSVSLNWLLSDECEIRKIG